MDSTLLDMASEKKAPTTENARIDREVMRKARRAAAWLDMTVPEYLASRLGPAVDADMAAITAEVVREASKSKRKP